jgi:hypothetical protein
MLGMLSKPIKDWIPEFPALHRLIIPGITNQDRKAARVKPHMKSQNMRLKCKCVNHKTRTGPGTERCYYGHPTGQEAGIPILPEERPTHTSTGENKTFIETQEPTPQ